MNKKLKSSVLFIIVPIVFYLMRAVGILIFRSYGVDEMGISNVFIPKLFLDFVLYGILGYLVFLYYEGISKEDLKSIKLILLYILLRFLSYSFYLNFKCR